MHQETSKFCVSMSSLLVKLDGKGSLLLLAWVGAAQAQFSPHYTSLLAYF